MVPPPPSSRPLLQHEGGDAPQPGCRRAFAQLSSLTRLALSLRGVASLPLDYVVDAIKPLTGLRELHVTIPSGVVPSDLMYLEDLRTLKFSGLKPCVLGAGCFKLPKLRSLAFLDCEFGDAQMPPDSICLQSLSCVRDLRMPEAAIL